MILMNSGIIYIYIHLWHWVYQTRKVGPNLCKFHNGICGCSCWAFGRAPQCSIGSRCRDKCVAEENLGLGRIHHTFICFFLDNSGGTCIKNCPFESVWYVCWYGLRVQSSGCSMFFLDIDLSQRLRYASSIPSRNGETSSRFKTVCTWRVLKSLGF